VRREAAVLHRPARAVRFCQRAFGSRPPSGRVALVGPARAAEALRLWLHTGTARAVGGRPQIAGRTLAAFRSRRFRPVRPTLLAFPDRTGRQPGSRRRTAPDRRTRGAAGPGRRAPADERW